MIFADLSVPNADLTSKVRVGPAEHKPVPTNVQVAEYLGNRWRVLANPGAALVVFPEESLVEALKPELPRENLLLSGELKKVWVLTATPQPGSFGINAPVRVQIDGLVPWRDISGLLQPGTNTLKI